LREGKELSSAAVAVVEGALELEAGEGVSEVAERPEGELVVDVVAKQTAGDGVGAGLG